MADARRPKDRDALPPARPRGERAGGSPPPRPPVVPVVPKAVAVPPKVVAVPPVPVAPAEAPAASAIPSDAVAAPAPAAPTTATAAPAVPAAPVPPKPVVPKPARVAGAPRPAPKMTGPDPLVGTQIGRCKILEKVGVGRTATVYRAHHEGLGLDVAVKILLPEVLRYPEVVAKFEQEARAIARLDHPNVLKIYDVVTEGERRGIVMEFLEGESVLEYIEHEGQVPPADALRVVRQAASGLAAAHAKGIIHRDVKPQNLVILEDGTVKLVDFGLATATGEDVAAQRIGTPHYMAPEACEAKPVEPASDVYSLGITLFHLLTGAPPYAGRTIKEILAAHVAAKPLEPEKVVRGLGDPICELVRSMTKRDALVRPTAQQVTETVDRIGGEDLVKHILLAPKRHRHRRRARTQTPLAAIAVGAAVVVGFVVFLMMRGSKPPPTPPTPPGPPVAQGPGEPEAPPAPGPGPDKPAVPPGPPPESPEEARARMAREAADRKTELENRKVRAQKALDEVAEFARAHWEDKASVVREYRVVARTYGDLDPGKEAKRRADGIEAGTVHPHPDRTYSEKSEVEKAQEAWDAVRKRVDEAVLAMRYDDALHLVPNTVQDPSGKLSSDLTFWRDLTTSLTGFFPMLTREVEAMKPAARTIGTPKGPGKVTRLSISGPSIQVGGETADYRWSDLAPADVADLARRAFTGKDSRTTEALAAFAWAHKLRDAFFQSAMAVKMSSGSAGAGTDFVDRMLGRAEERFKKP